MNSSIQYDLLLDWQQNNGPADFGKMLISHFETRPETPLGLIFDNGEKAGFLIKQNKDIVFVASEKGFVEAELIYTMP